MDDETTSEAMFMPDQIGQYIIQLKVVGHTGIESPSDMCPSDQKITVNVDTSRRLVVQMTWNTPFPANPDGYVSGSDLDLHMLPPSRGVDPTMEWGSSASIDCYYANKMTDWGAILEIDDLNGDGPEKISMVNPDSSSGQPYLVGAHAYRISPTDGADVPSPTSVKVFFDGVVAGEFNYTFMTSKDMWEVATITWNGNMKSADAVQNRVYNYDPFGSEDPGF